MAETAGTTAKRVMLIGLLAVLATTSVASGVEEAENGQDGPGLAVPRWLVAGPEPVALPAFHDAADGGVGIVDLLDAAALPLRPWYPQDEEQFPSASGALRFRREIAGDGDRVRLLAEREGPAAAWVAVRIRTERWREVEIEVTGTHPRRAWLDGEPLAKGGTSGADDRVKGEAQLPRGTHVLVAYTIRDPERDEPWTIGAVVRAETKASEKKKEEKEKEAEKEKEGEVSGAPRGDGWPAAANATDVFALDEARDLTLLDVLDPPQVSSMALSPDGTLAALAVRRYRPGTDERESWIEIRRTGDGTTERTFRGAPSMSEVEWVPGEGRRLSYVTSHDKKSTLWVADLEAGTTVPVVEQVERWGGYEWSPRGDRVAYSASVEPEKDETGIKRLEGIQDRWADFRKKSYLHLATFPGGATRRLTAGPETTSLHAFSPDGARILFSRRFEDVSRRPYSRAELWEMETATGETRKIAELGWLTDAEYSPDGTRILVQAGPSAFDGAGSVVPEGVLPNDYDGQLYIHDPATGETRAITRDFDPAVAAARWSRADGAIYARAEDGDFVRLYRRAPGTDGFEVLDPGIEVVRDFALADGEGGVVLVRGTSVWRPQEVVALDPGANEVLWSQRPSGDRLEHVRLGEVRPWTFESSDGKTIDGRVYLPPGFDPKWRYPALVYFYGGTSPVNRAFGGRYPKEWWAAQGYVVYVLQPSGATGYGQEFSAAHVNDWGDVTSREIVEGTAKFLDAHPFVDPDRVGCLGASYGGFMTMRVITETDRFAAAVSHAGISALSSYWGEGYWGYSYGAVANAGSFPWNRKDIFVEGSPLFRADKVKTPLLLTHGGSDTNVPRGESDQFYIALKLLGVPVEYLQVEGQDHWILDHDKRLLWSRSIVAWFDRWLKDEPGWWNHLYP